MHGAAVTKLEPEQMDSTKAVDESFADGKELEAKTDQVSTFCLISLPVYPRRFCCTALARASMPLAHHL